MASPRRHACRAGIRLATGRERFFTQEAYEAAHANMSTGSDHEQSNSGMDTLADAAFSHSPDYDEDTPSMEEKPKRVAAARTEGGSKPKAAKMMDVGLRGNQGRSSIRLQRIKEWASATATWTSPA